MSRLLRGIQGRTPKGVALTVSGGAKQLVGYETKGYRQDFLFMALV